MTAFQWAQLILGAIGAIVLPLLLVAFRTMRTLRDNDLHDLRVRLDRIEGKIDDHIVFHAGRHD